VAIGSTLWNRRVRMRDGVEIAADVVLPEGDGPWPAVVLRTPYMRGRAPRLWDRLVDHGYAYVTVDVRGRGDSDGEFTLYVNDADDGYDMIEWVAAQAWCSGRVGMVGTSYEGYTQWWTAKSRPPHLACIAPFAANVADLGPRRSCDTGVPYQYRIWPCHLMTGKTMQHPGSPSWHANWDHLPLRDWAEQLGTARKWWSKYVAGEIDHLGQGFAFAEEDWEQFEVPTLIGVGWWDTQDAMAGWMAVKRSPAGRNSRLLIGAWDHNGNEWPRPVLGGLDVSESAIDTIGYVERFLALHLKDDREALKELSRCRVFRTGAMRWEELEDWPSPEAAPVSWYLGEDASLRPEPGAVGGASEYVYDPSDPVRDFSDLESMGWSDPPLDSRYLLRRDDVLVFTSAELETSVSVSGQAMFDGFVSVDVPDTDISISLYDVYPDGRFILLSGWVQPPTMLRLSLRNGVDPEPLVPGEPVRIQIPAVWLHHTFLPGHRIAVAVTSSWFPIFARNLNTGESWPDAVHPRVARVSVHYGPEHPSRFVLPVESGGES
jgi:putative CocE/NonD family hydrolase